MSNVLNDHDHIEFVCKIDNTLNRDSKDKRHIRRLLELLREAEIEIFEQAREIKHLKETISAKPKMLIIY